MSISGGFNRVLLDLNVHIWWSQQILLGLKVNTEFWEFVAGAAAAQQLWHVAGSCVHCEQEANIFQVSLTSKKYVRCVYNMYTERSFVLCT